VRQLTVLQFAQQSGFTIAEIQTLFHGFKEGTPPAARWQKLARQKLEELDALVARAQQMRQMIEAGMQCGCLRWEDCVMLAGDNGCQVGPPAKPPTARSENRYSRRRGR
jgi:MerR family redox-sensitive transcriptional activator SoxR